MTTRNDKALRSAKVLLVVPPFASIRCPSLGVHILQAVLRSAGIATDVFYANIILAKRIGVDIYEWLAYSPTRRLMGERLFAPYVTERQCWSKSAAKCAHPPNEFDYTRLE